MTKIVAQRMAPRMLSGTKRDGGSRLAPISTGPMMRKPYIKRTPITNSIGWRAISLLARVMRFSCPLSREMTRPSNRRPMKYSS